MRPDGTRVRDLTAIMQALPYVMPKRYDAQNWAEENLDEDAIRDYIRAKRREGRSVTHMSLLVSAYYRAVLKNPKINYFVMNRRIYKRNHFCFSFVILRPGGRHPGRDLSESVSGTGGHGVYRDGEDSLHHREEPERPAQ